MIKGMRDRTTESGAAWLCVSFVLGVDKKAVQRDKVTALQLHLALLSATQRVIKS